jgi:UDP-glucose-4-epimerase GalE
MKAVLVTGGAGYIGSHTCKALSRAGFQPVVLDDLSAGNRWAVKWGPFEEGNIRDRALVGRLVKQHNIEAVIHFAAHAYVGESMQAPGKYFQNNVANTLHLLDALVDAGADKVVFSSTCATYGMPAEIPISETHPQLPVNPYGESKLFVERALRWYGEAHGTKSVCLRYFNAAGADPEGEIGEHHNPETHLVPSVIEAALGVRPFFDLYGDDYQTFDGTAIRDYIHVCDLASAHVLALGYLFAGGKSDVFNLGTGEGSSIHQVIETVELAGGVRVRTRVQPRRAGDPPQLVASAMKAHAELGWRPEFSALDNIVSTAWQWHSRWHAERAGETIPAV